MTKNKQIRAWNLTVSLLLMFGGVAGAFTNDPTVGQYYFGQDKRLPVRVIEEQVFKPAEQQANFTFFTGVQGVEVKDGVLRFALTGPKATLGWGNYGGRQTPETYKKMAGNFVELAVKQSAGESVWTFYPWADGQRIGKGDNPKGQKPITLQGGVATNLVVAFRADQATPIHPDGFEIEIQGATGMVVEISSVKCARKDAEGYVRHEFEVPAGKVWRALAYIGAFKLPGPYGVAFYLNGREVPRNGAWVYHTESIDVTSLIQPGKKNCAGLYGKGAWGAMQYCQITVVMESGEIVRCATDDTWKYSPEVKDGWSRSGYNDASWTSNLASQAGLYGYAKYGSPVPEYDGRLIIKNPQGRYLFYTDAADTVLEVRIPAGLRTKKPVLDYQLGRAGTNGLSAIIGEKTLSSFSEKEGSLICPVNVGKLKGGVYTVALRLRSGNEVLEVRPREPFLVARRLPDKTASAGQFKEALDLELEDQIDFTDPKDPHPWIESEIPPGGGPAPAVKEPVVVRKAGLVYRKTAATRGSTFSYRLGEFKHVGDFYLMELEYPDDDDRWTDILVTSKAYGGAIYSSQSGVGYTSGGKFYKTGKMLKLYWIHVADPAVHSIDVSNGRNGMTAAAKSIKIWHIKGDLPALAAGASRVTGIHSERCHPGSGLGKNFGVVNPPPAGKDEEEVQLNRPLMERYIQDLTMMLPAAERYAQYLKFVGQNHHIMGCFQYTEGNTPYVSAPQMTDCRMPNCLKSVFGSVAEVNGIGLYAGLEICGWMRDDTVANNLDIARGADTIWMVDADGKQVYYTRVPAGATARNWAHPVYRRSLQDLMRDLSRTFGHLSCFKGAHMLLTPSQRPGGYYLPGFVFKGNFENPYEQSYDDVTFQQFEAETGVHLPIAADDPQRFTKRAVVMRNDTLKSQFRQWRCAKLKQVLVEAQQALNGQWNRSDLELLAIPTIEVPKMYLAWQASGASFKDFLRDCAIDLPLLGNVPGVYLGRWTISWNTGSEQNPYLWLPKENPEIVAAFDFPKNRYVLCRSSWDENSMAAPGGSKNAASPLAAGSDWIVSFTGTRSLPQPAGYHSREALIQALITGDPDILMTGFTDLNINVGNEDLLRPFWAVYTALPREKFLPVLNTDLRSNVVVRQLQHGGQAWFYVANPGYWQNRVKLVLKTEGAVSRVPDNKPVTLSRRGPEAELTLDLEPYGLAAFCSDDVKLELLKIETADISPEERAHLEGIMARVTGLMDQPETRIILPLKDQEYMRTILKSAADALAAREYSRSWSFLKDAQFWDLWKNFLEKAAQAVAFLPKEIKVEKQENLTALPTLKAVRVKSKITVDGKLDEAEWSQTPYNGGFVTRDKKPAFDETAFNAAYDGQNLYLAFVCADRDVKELREKATNEKDLFAVGDDVIAMFVQPDETVPVYYQLAFNGKGVRFDQKVSGGEKDYAFQPEWKTAAQKQAGYWSAEVMIPYAALGSQGLTAKWRINCHRVYRDNLVEPCSWSFSGLDWHQPARFGKLEPAAE